MTVWWNGALMDSDKVRVPIVDATYLRGEGVFETIRALEGKPLYFSDHYKRLESSAGRLGFRVPDAEELRGGIEEVLAANELREARIRVTLGENCLLTTVALEPEVLGVKVVTREDYPINERSPLAGIKCTSYAENMTLLRLGGTPEVLRPNMRGELCEGCVSNVFFVKDGKLFTPALETGCLPGVMRRQVIERVKVEEGCWPFEMINEADEIWLTNSVRKLRYVEELNGKAMPEPSALIHKLRSEIA